MSGIQEGRLVPVRLGAILRMIRRQQDKGVMKIAEDSFVKTGDCSAPFSGVSKIHHTTWSGYELGTRMPGDDSLENLIDVIYIFFKTIPTLSMVDLAFKDLLKELHYKDQLIWSSRDVLPLRYIGAMVLAYFLHGPADIERDPIPDDYYWNNDLTDPGFFAELIYYWYYTVQDDHFHNFRFQFANWLLRENKFNSRKVIGQAKSISDAEKYFAEPNNKQASRKPSTWAFCAEVLRDGLFFEFLGPAIDAILSFSKSIQYVPESGELKIEVYTQEGGTRPLNLRVPM